MTEREQAVALAAKLLKLSESEAQAYSHDLGEDGALYFSVPLKGGDSLIVSFSGEVLYANSSVSYEEHLEAFRSGSRTPLEAFDA